MERVIHEPVNVHFWEPQPEAQCTETRHLYCWGLGCVGRVDPTGRYLRLYAFHRRLWRINLWMPGVAAIERWCRNHGIKIRKG